MNEQEFTRYKITCEGVSTEIRIRGVGKSLNYELTLPEFQMPTLALLDNIKSKLIVEMDISGIEVFDEKVIEKLKRQFSKRAEELIIEELPNISNDNKYHLVSKLIREMLGLGDIEFLLSDDNLEELVINSSKENVRVYHKKFGWLNTGIRPKDEAQIQNFANIIARRVGRQITTLNPLLDAHLVTGDRSNTVLFPISSKGNTLTIRKFARDPWTVVDFIKNNTLPAEHFAILWLAFEYELNVLFSGGTAAGKTSILNVCMPFIPPNHRIISIEDTRELQLPATLHWVPMQSRLPNPEGKGEITMLDCMINALRMRPDRIILGEIRRQEEAEVMFEAMHTGHSVYATIHANNAHEVVTRLTNAPIDIPKPMLSSLSLVIVQNRNRRTNKRRTLQLAEILPNGDPNILLQLNIHDDILERVNESDTMVERLELYTGLTRQELELDLRQKIRILKWLVKEKIENVNEIGLVLAKYYMGHLKLE